MSETKALHFWTTGEAYMGLVDDLFRSGEFHKVEQLLLGLPEDKIKQAFEYKLVMTGSTKDGGELECGFLAVSPENYPITLYFALSTYLDTLSRKTHYTHENNFFKVYNIYDIKKKYIGDKDLNTFFKYINIETFFSVCWKQILWENGFGVTTLYDAIYNEGQKNISGVLLPSGVFIQCGYQQHSELFPYLQHLNLVQGDRFNGDGIAISSNMLSGQIAFVLESSSYTFGEYTLTTQQFEELWKVREFKITHYSSNSSTSLNEQLLSFYVHHSNLGNKHANLKFLQKYFPEIKLPKFSEKYEDIGSEKAFLRTSPLKSIPGLLTSIVVNNIEESKKAEVEIITTFEKFKDIKRGNKLYYFYQEFIEGKNGVINCTEKLMDEYPRTKMSPEFILRAKYDIEIACSDEQGKVVMGYVTNSELSPEVTHTLRNIIRPIAAIFDTNVQMEFVVTPDDVVYIVQMRLLNNNPKTVCDAPANYLEGAVVHGISFSNPSTYSTPEILGSNILIVDSDCESERLIGKEALIVKQNIAFSHILALSKALNIPSIFATGEVVLDPERKYTINTDYRTGYIKEVL